MSVSDKPEPPVAWVDTENSDPYAWLRADNWREVLRDPSTLPQKIRAYIEAENAYTVAQLAPLADLQSELFDELKGRLQPDDFSVPIPDGPFAYYQRFESGHQYPLYCRTDADRVQDAAGGDAEQILLDSNAAASAYSFFDIRRFQHSPDHRRIAYSIDTSGGESYQIIVRDIASDEILDECVAQANGSFVWTADSAGFLYQRLNDSHRGDRLFYHRIGTPISDDTLIYREDDPTFMLRIALSDSGRFIQIISEDEGDTAEVRLLPRDKPDARPQLIAARRKGFYYDVQDHDAGLLIRTNADGADDYQIMQTGLTAPEPENWKPLVAHSPGSMILNMTVFDTYFVRTVRENALPHIVVHTFASAEERTVSFEDAAYDVRMPDRMPYKGRVFRVRYSSPKTPARIYDIDAVTHDRLLLKQQQIPSGHDPESYIVVRIQVPGHNGADIPVTILHHKDHPLDGTGPILLQGYGAYGMAMPAAFSPHRFSLVDRGMAFGLAHVRGGSDKGYHWHRHGKLENKTNTFKDFISVASHLTDHGLVRKNGVVANGGSAGGLLMGAIANMRPDLFQAIIAEVPFVDVLNTISDATLPLTPPEWNEWGNPITDSDVAARLRNYAPYENVAAVDYPSMLITGGLTDYRVTYWEPAKWTAKLRSMKTDTNPLLLWMHMGAGHSGASGRYDYLHEIARVWAFALSQTANLSKA